MLRGEVRLIAATVTRLHEQGAADLARTDWVAWRSLRTRLDQRRQARTLRTRFRRDPQAYLRALEQKAIQLTLPT